MLGSSARRLAFAITKSSSVRIPRPVVPIPTPPLASIIHLLNQIDRLPHMGKKTCYAVVRGRVPGLYRTWDDCAAQVKGWKGNMYKGFGSEREARQYLAANNVEYVGEPMGEIVQAPAPKRQKRAEKKELDAINDNELNEKSAVEALLASKQSIEEENVLVKKTSHKRPGTVRIEFDGASKNNPGPAGFGAALFDNDTNAEIDMVYHYMGPHHTNNQAEYAGLIAGLQAALDHGYTAATVQGDSMLVVNQLLGKWQVKNEGLMPYNALARKLMRKFEKFEAKQVPRAQNSVADALSNRAIDEWVQGTLTEMWTLSKASKLRNE